MTEDDRSARDIGDEELLQRAIQASEGDLRAFEELVERHQKRIAADCRYMTRDANSAEDLAQEIFVKAYFGLRTFEGRSSFRHWLQRIKVHHCLNHLKKQESMKQVTLEEEIRADSVKLHVSPTADRNLEAMDDRRQIAAILDLLPSTHKRQLSGAMNMEMVKIVQHERRRAGCSGSRRG
jgi:RNA polymerase sigma factor (sigma-70 family)